MPRLAFLSLSRAGVYVLLKRVLDFGDNAGSGGGRQRHGACHVSGRYAEEDNEAVEECGGGSDRDCVGSDKRVGGAVS